MIAQNEDAIFMLDSRSHFDSRKIWKKLYKIWISLSAINLQTISSHLQNWRITQIFISKELSAVIVMQPQSTDTTKYSTKLKKQWIKYQSLSENLQKSRTLPHKERTHKTIL